MAGMARSENKIMYLFLGAAVIASVSFLGYSLTRPTKPIKAKAKITDKPKSKKFKHTFTQKPFDIHLVMNDDKGFHAHVAADKKNEKLGLKFGARLIKIGEKDVENLTFEEIVKILSKSKVPVTITFREYPELEQAWNRAENAKEEANNFYKNEEIVKGIESATEAINLHPTNKVYYSNRVLMYLKEKEYDKALSDCQTIRELDPTSEYIKGHYLRGLVLFNLEKYKHAAAAFQTVIKLSPDFTQASDRLKQCEIKIKKEREEFEKRRSSEQQDLQNQLLKVQQSLNAGQEQRKEQEEQEEQEEQPAQGQGQGQEEEEEEQQQQQQQQEQGQEQRQEQGQEQEKQEREEQEKQEREQKQEQEKKELYQLEQEREQGQEREQEQEQEKNLDQLDTNVVVVKPEQKNSDIHVVVLHHQKKEQEQEQEKNIDNGNDNNNNNNNNNNYYS